jgi:hypothetical protein
MRHKSYLTTQVYISMSRQIDDAVNVLHVPEVLRKKPETDQLELPGCQARSPLATNPCPV